MWNSKEPFSSHQCHPPFLPLPSTPAQDHASSTKMFPAFPEETSYLHRAERWTSVITRRADLKGWQKEEEYWSAEPATENDDPWLVSSDHSAISRPSQVRSVPLLPCTTYGPGVELVGRYRRSLMVKRRNPCVLRPGCPQAIPNWGPSIHRPSPKLLRGYSWGLTSLFPVDWSCVATYQMLNTQLGNFYHPLQLCKSHHNPAISTQGKDESG
nr:uncharacterized protein LOC112991830 [Dromaius novaehollandiae]